MFIIAITSCTSGLAHTYIAKERLETTAKDLGIEIMIETQGALGVETQFCEGDITRADAVLIASDIDIEGIERFNSKCIVHVPINRVVRNPKDTLSEVIQSVKQ